MTLSAGVLGAGLMGRWHVHALKKLGINIAACIDINIDTSRKLAATCQAAAFSTLGGALKESEFDVLHICTPAGTHVAYAHQALDAGKHTVVEKPVAGSYIDTRNLVEKAAARGVTLCPVHQFGYQRGVEKIKEVLVQRTEPALSIQFDVATAGGEGMTLARKQLFFLDILPHFFSLLIELWPGASLDTSSWRCQESDGENVIFWGEHAGIPVSCRISTNARPTQCELKISHSQGQIYADLFHGFSVFESARVSRAAKILRPFENSLKHFGVATINLISRGLSRQPAYPGLNELLSAYYRTISAAGTPPISNAHLLAVVRAVEQIGINEGWQGKRHG